MTLDDFKSEVLDILRTKDVTGSELIRTIISRGKEDIKSLGLEKYDVENAASMGNLIAKEIMPFLGVPVYKGKKYIKGKKQTIYSLQQTGNKRPVEPPVTERKEELEEAVSA